MACRQLKTTRIYGATRGAAPAQARFLFFAVSFPSLAHCSPTPKNKTNPEIPQHHVIVFAQVAGSAPTASQAGPTLCPNVMVRSSVLPSPPAPLLFPLVEL
jgi:hypothetical protein